MTTQTPTYQKGICPGGVGGGLGFGGGCLILSKLDSLQLMKPKIGHTVKAMIAAHAGASGSGSSIPRNPHKQMIGNPITAPVPKGIPRIQKKMFRQRSAFWKAIAITEKEIIPKNQKAQPKRSPNKAETRIRPGSSWPSIQAAKSSKRKIPAIQNLIFNIF